MRALASQERLTFKRVAASFAVSRGEGSRCCLFAGVLLIIQVYSRRPRAIAGLRKHDLIGLRDLIPAVSDRRRVARACNHKSPGRVRFWANRTSKPTSPNDRVWTHKRHWPDRNPAVQQAPVKRFFGFFVTP